jgi:hypothetical protein
MHYKFSTLPAVVVALLSMLPFTSQAEQAQKFGSYVVHYNTLQTTFLAPKVAREYQITRSQNRAMLNISVQEMLDQKPKSVPATIKASATNLTGQLKTINMRPVRDGDVIYYIGEFGVEDQEVLDFTVDVQPEGDNSTHTVQFREQFFTR